MRLSPCRPKRAKHQETYPVSLDGGNWNVPGGVIFRSRSHHDDPRPSIFGLFNAQNTFQSVILFFPIERTGIVETRRRLGSSHVMRRHPLSHQAQRGNTKCGKKKFVPESPPRYGGEGMSFAFPWRTMLCPSGSFHAPVLRTVVPKALTSGSLA